jgi:hypothetical protein
MRLTLASLIVATCWTHAFPVYAALPTPGCKASTGGGSTYVGTVNPGTVTAGGPPAGVPPIDVGALSVMITDGPGGSRDVTVHGGILQAVHFGIGLSQVFEGDASIDGFVHAEIGSIHLATSAAAETLPLRYEAPFPGALGENPFYAQAFASISGCCDDVVTVPATLNAPNAGDLTTVTLQVGYSGHETEGADYDIDLRDAPRPSAFLSLADGTDLGGVISGGRMLRIPVLTPIALRFCFTGGLTVTAGHDLPNQYYGTVYQHGGDVGSDHAFYDALNTAEIKLVNEDGAGATGATGHDYGTLSGGATVTTTTSTTTTSIFVPPSTLPTCKGYCGDGIVQPDCAETCECPMVGGLAVAACDAGTATPSLTPSCARCAGCQVDLSPCASPTTSSTSTTVPGPAITTTTTPTGPPATTSTTVPCRTVRCILAAGLESPACAGETIPPAITNNLDRATGLVEQAGDGGVSKRVRRLIKGARRDLALANSAAKKAARGKKHKLTVACAAAIESAAGTARDDLGL